jgi:hypothetical protein
MLTIELKVGLAGDDSKKEQEIRLDYYQYLLLNSSSNASCVSPYKKIFPSLSTGF